MNSTIKNTLYVVGAVIIIGILMTIARNYSGSKAVDENATTTDAVATTTQTTVFRSGKQASAGGSASQGSNASKGTDPLQDVSVLSTLVGNNVVIRVPQTGVDVALTAGEADFTDSNGRIKGHVVIGSVVGSIKTTDGYDVFADMMVTREGEVQVQHYAALFHVTSSKTVRYTSAVLIGDRLPITGVTASPDRTIQVNPSSPIMNSAIGYFVNISYLTRKNAEPMTAAPTLSKSVVVGVKNHIATR